MRRRPRSATTGRSPSDYRSCSEGSRTDESPEPDRRRRGYSVEGRSGNRGGGGEMKDRRWIIGLGRDRHLGRRPGGASARPLHPPLGAQRTCRGVLARSVGERRHRAHAGRADSRQSAERLELRRQLRLGAADEIWFGDRTRLEHLPLQRRSRVQLLLSEHDPVLCRRRARRRHDQILRRCPRTSRIRDRLHGPASRGDQVVRPSQPTPAGGSAPSCGTTSSGGAPTTTPRTTSRSPAGCRSCSASRIARLDRPFFNAPLR